MKKIILKKTQTENQTIEDLENRLTTKVCEGKCPICSSEIVKDFKDAMHDRVCSDCLSDMKDLTTDMKEEMPTWVIMDIEATRKALIEKHFKHDFPDKYEQIINDFFENELMKKEVKEFDHKKIMEEYYKLKLHHPEYDERKLLEEVFSNISKNKKERKKDFITDFIHDNFEDLEKWVRNTIKPSESEVIPICWKIINSKKKVGEKKDKKEKPKKSEMERYLEAKEKGQLPSQKKSDKRTKTEKEKEWQETWQEIAGMMEKQRIERIKKKERDIMMLSEEEYAMAMLGRSTPYLSYSEYIEKYKREKKLKEIEKRMSPEQLRKLKIHYGMGVSGEIGRHEKRKGTR